MALESIKHYHPNRIVTENSLFRNSDESKEVVGKLKEKE